MDVLSDSISYSDSNLFISELFIPRTPIPKKILSNKKSKNNFDELKISNEASKTETENKKDKKSSIYIKAVSVSINDYTFPKEKFTALPFSYFYDEQSNFKILLLYLNTSELNDVYAKLFSTEIFQRLNAGLKNLYALSFLEFELNSLEQTEVDFSKAKKEDVPVSIVLEYKCFIDKKEFSFLLLIPAIFLNFLVQSATANIGLSAIDIESIFRILQQWIFFIMNGMESFPWRLDSFLEFISKTERDKLIQKLLEKHYVNFEQLSSICVSFPHLEKIILESLSKANKEEFTKQLSYFKKINNSEWFKQVNYSVKIAIGHLLFHDNIFLESLEEYYKLKSVIENYTEIEMLNLKSLDTWILESSSRDIDIAIHALGVRKIAKSFLIRDISIEAEELVLANISKQGVKDYSDEMKSLQAKTYTSEEVQDARIEFVKEIRNINLNKAYKNLENKIENLYPLSWWLRAVEDEFHLFKIYSESGFPLFAQALDSEKNLEQYNNFFAAIPDVAAELIKSIVSQSISSGSLYSPERVSKAERNIIKNILRLFFSGRISLKIENEKVIKGALCSQ